MHEKSHVVERLPVQLPYQQSVMYRTGKEHETVQAKQGDRTKLQAWLKLNQDEYAEAKRRHAEGDATSSAPPAEGASAGDEVRSAPVADAAYGYDVATATHVWPCKSLDSAPKAKQHEHTQ